uniref:Interleukin-1 n=1 Tax=Capra hircus TaxID=9925 RepID=A0A8C2NVA4_CAPHI
MYRILPVWADCPEHFTGIHNEDSLVWSPWSLSRVPLRTRISPECPASLEKQPATPWERDPARCKPSEKIDAVPIEPHTMFLGIHGGKLCLACVKSGDEIKLKLEAVNITDLNQNREQDKRFAFIRSDNGPTTSFESAACPGWFLCTSLEADQPVGLTNTPTEAIKVTRFYLQQD